ncbi:MAG: TonB family protein [Candidatus Acidiferrales bacterium]
MSILEVVSSSHQASTIGVWVILRLNLMKLKLSTAIFLFFLLPFGNFKGAENPEMCLCQFKAPAYPQIARLAHITGDVHIHLTFDSEGNVLKIGDPEGSRFLYQGITDALKSWRFCPSSNHDANRELTITFRYQLEGDGGDGWAFTDVSFNSPATVEITTRPPATETKKSVHH